jgi:predicted nucleic acid-binding protein
MGSRTFTQNLTYSPDCTSKVVIERLGLTHALSFDQHFLQFGTVTVVP